MMFLGHGLVVWLMLLVTPHSVFAVSNVIFMSGMEEGDATAATGPFYGASSGTAIADATIRRTGTYSLQVSSGGFRQFHSFFSSSYRDAYFRGYVYLSALPSIDTIIWETRTNASAIQNQLWITTTGTLAYAFNNGAYIATSSGTFILGQWNLVETHVVISATVGGMELQLNGTTEFTSFATNTGTDVPQRWTFGPYKGGGQAINYDDIRIGITSYPGPGQIIARQGIAGTPTYTAWTTTGGAIDVVWSDTPFNAATNAAISTSLAGQRQSMVVAPFSSVQAGHGSEIIRAGDTINAVVAAYVAKASLALNLPMILNGIDRCDSSEPGVSASDSWQTNGYSCANGYTITFADINAAQVGGKTQNAGAGTYQIEDAWLMVDYTPTGVVTPVKVRQN